MCARKKTVVSARNRARQAEPSLGEPESLQRVLRQMLSVAAHGGELNSLLSSFCRESRKFLKVSGVGYWELQEAEHLLKPLEADGNFTERFKQAPLSLEDSPVVIAAIREARPASVNQSKAGSQQVPYGAKSFLAAPVMVFGRVIGVVAFLHQTKAGFFVEGTADQVSLLAEQLGSLLELFRLKNTAGQHRKRSEDLIELAMDLGSSLRLPDFAKSFTARITEILRARVGVLALARGTLIEVVALHDQADEPDRAVQRSLNLRLTELVQEGTQMTAITPAEDLLGKELAGRLGCFAARG